MVSLGLNTLLFKVTLTGYDFPEAKLLETDFVKVANKNEIPVGKTKKVQLNGKEILVANVNGSYYAIGARCPHKNGDLSQGSFEGNVVTCPNHGAKFDVTTGKVISPPKMGLFHPKIIDEPTYLVKTENEDVLIKLGI
jgi:3-phenylpropionate/trans-cinnamate dioxygenase ferredoxin component